jgi:hypothetical protein
MSAPTGKNVTLVAVVRRAGTVGRQPGAGTGRVFVRRGGTALGCLPVPGLSPTVRGTPPYVPKPFVFETVRFWNTLQRGMGQASAQGFWSPSACWLGIWS